MNKLNDSQYEDLLHSILYQGAVKTDRTGTGTVSIFGPQLRYNLQQGFPLITTKKVATRLVIEELLWMLRGSTNNNELVEKNVHIWDEWADPNGELGPIYGKQWRSWPTPDKYGYAGQGLPVDQIAEVVATLKTNPDSRRMVVSAWNVADLPEMALMPCHCLFQFYTRPATFAERLVHIGGKKAASTLVIPNEIDRINDKLDAADTPKVILSCQLYQRSADMFLGVPFNIASYALLTHMMAQQCNMIPGEFIWTGGDCHIYSNHQEQVNEQIRRPIYEFPTLCIATKPADIFSYKVEDFVFDNYIHGAPIKGQVAV